MENILKTLTTLCTTVDSIGLRVQKLKENAEKSKATSQQHDYKHAELRRSADGKLKGDVGKLPKTHNVANVAGTSTGAMEKTTSKNTNLNNLFTKPFIPKVQIVDTPTPQTSTYAASLHKEMKTYNHISQVYIENLYKIKKLFKSQTQIYHNHRKNPGLFNPKITRL